MIPLCKKIGLIFICALFIGMLGLVVSIPIANDAIANQTAQRVAELPLPRDTEYLESFSAAGKLEGCGNGMQYLGGILLQSELPLEELRTYYGQYAEREGEYIVQKQTGQNLQFVEHRTVSLKTDVNGEDFFVVYAWGTAPSLLVEYDLRGH